MNAQQIAAYFSRIGTSVPDAPDVDALFEIQRRHILNVPFENLDIIAGDVPLSLETADLFDKVVTRRRGGFCYELNLLLGDMLALVGFDVTMLSGSHPKYGDDFDHAFLGVRARGDERLWVVDVGFADNFREPLPFEPGAWTNDGRDDYQFRPTRENPKRYELVRMRADAEAVMFTFELQPRSRADYQPRCNWYATSPESRFTQGPLVCIEHDGGRISLTMNRLLNTFNGQRLRQDIESEEDFTSCLKEVFGIEK